MGALEMLRRMRFDPSGEGDFYAYFRVVFGEERELMYKINEGVDNGEGGNSW